MLTRLRRPDHGGDAGLSLIELLVAMGLASIIGAMALAWFIGSSTANTATVDANITTASARNVLESWAWYLRLAHPAADGTPAVTALSATSITFGANLGALPSCTTSCATDATTPVTLQFNSAATTKDSTLTQTTGSNTGTVLTGQIDAGGCLFTALDASGNSLGCSNVSAALIRGVQIGFTAVTDSGHAQPFQTTATFTEPSGSTS